MKVGQKIDQGLEYFIRIFQWIVSIMLIVVTLLITAQVVARAFFNYSIVWAEEVSLIGFIYITFFTLAIAMRYDLHLRVEIGVSWLPVQGRKVIEFIDNLVLLGISVLMLWTGIKLAQYGVASIMPATRWKTSIIYYPTPIAGAVCTLQQILRILGIARSETAEAFIERGNTK